MAKVCVVVLLGLPGSGKSSLTRHLTQKSKSSFGVTGDSEDTYRMICLEYDQLLPSDVEKHLIEESCDMPLGQQDSSPWKQYRSDIVTCVDQLLSFLCLSGGLKKADRIPSELWGIFVDHVSRSLPGDDLSDKKTCIVIDDNMYYRSMRHVYYQLARKYTIGFCQLHLDCDLQTAITQNSQREMSVSDDVIVTMATRLEAPDPAKFHWEENTLCVSLSKTEDAEIYKLIDRALSNPVQPIQEVDEELRALSRVVCSESFVHQSDQILRRLVSEEMISAKERKVSKDEMKMLAASLQKRRKQILEDLRSGKLTVPGNIVSMATDSAKDSESQTYKFISDLFTYFEAPIT